MDIRKELNNASRLKNYGNYRQALELFDELYRNHPEEFKPIHRQDYAWLIYRVSVQNFKDEYDLFESVEFITNLVGQLDLNIRRNRNSCTYTSAVFAVLNHLKDNSDYYNMLYWLDKVNPELLDKKAYWKNGRWNKSKMERYYDLAAMAYLDCSDYEACIDMSKTALDTFDRFISDGDAWHCWRIGKSLNRLGRYEESILYMKEVFKVKHEWYMYRVMADNYYRLKNPLEAMKYLCPAVLSRTPSKTKVNLYHLIFDIFKTFNFEVALKHAQLFYLIKLENGHQVPEDIQRLNIDETGLSRKDLEREIRDLWVLYKFRNEKLHHGTVTRFIEDKNYGFIRSDDGKSVFFHKSEFKCDMVYVGQEVSFYMERSFDKSKNRQSLKAVHINQAEA